MRADCDRSCNVAGLNPSLSDNCNFATAACSPQHLIAFRAAILRTAVCADSLHQVQDSLTCDAFPLAASAMAQGQRDSKRARMPSWKAQAAFDEATADGEADDTPEVVHAAPPPRQPARARVAASQAPDLQPPESSTAAATFPLTQLPRDLLPQVLSFLDSPDLLRLSQVCQPAYL